MGAIARAYWERAGLTDRTELRLAPSTETLAAIPHDPPIDLAVDDRLWGGAVPLGDGLALLHER